MHTQKSKELADLGFFDQSFLESHQQLLNSVCTVTFQPGDTLYHSDEESSTLYIIQQGLVKLVSFMDNGRNRIVRLHRQSSFIGMDGLMNTKHEHDCIAINEVRAYQIPHSELLRLKEDEPHLYNQLLEKWYEYLQYADTWITEFSTGNIKGRVARLVKFLSHFDPDTGPQIVELLTTEEMSEILGVTPESVSRVIAEFKRDGILTTIENNVESLFECDQEKLDKVVG
jgi:CRP-like cAMP-binding protein